MAAELSVKAVCSFWSTLKEQHNLWNQFGETASKKLIIVRETFETKR
jgi:hypothetical protein